MMVAETPPILDGHNDTLLRLYLPERGGSRTLFARSDLGHIDLPRARDGGFAGGFFALFVPSDLAARQANEADRRYVTVRPSCQATKVQASARSSTSLVTGLPWPWPALDS